MNYKNIIPYIALMVMSVILYRQCTTKIKPEIKVITKTIKVPEYINNFDTITIFKPFKKVLVDSIYKEKYLKAKDSLERLNLYLEAIKIKEYNEKFTDTFQTINVYTKTRGTLLAQSLSYKTFKRDIIYKDTIFIKPRRMLSIGLETSTNLDIKASLLYTTRKKTIYSIGIDANKNISGGIFIPIFK
jgi:hypothetical protein